MPHSCEAILEDMRPNCSGVSCFLSLIAAKRSGVLSPLNCTVWEMMQIVWFCTVKKKLVWSGSSYRSDNCSCLIFTLIMANLRHKRDQWTLGWLSSIYLLGKQEDKKKSRPLETSECLMMNFLFASDMCLSIPFTCSLLVAQQIQNGKDLALCGMCRLLGRWSCLIALDRIQTMS